MGKRGIENSKHRIFAEKLTGGLAAPDAYLAAGYKSTTRASAEAAASRLRRQPEVAALIRHLHTTAQEEARQDATYSLKQMLAYLARILDTGADTLPDGDPLIAYTRTFSDGSKSTRMPDKLCALRTYADLCGYTLRPEPKPAREPKPKPIDPAGTPMARYIHTIRARPAIYPEPITPQDDTHPLPKSESCTTGRAEPKRSVGGQHEVLGVSPSVLSGRQLSEPADASCAVSEAKPPTPRAHANTSTPSKTTEKTYPNLTSQPPGAASPATAELTPPSPPPILAWPDDPACNFILRGDRPKVQVIR